MITISILLTFWSREGFVKKLFLKSHKNVNFSAIFVKRAEQSGFSEGYFFKDNRGKLIFWTCFFMIYRAKRIFLTFINFGSRSIWIIFFQGSEQYGFFVQYFWRNFKLATEPQGFSEEIYWPTDQLGVSKYIS